MAMNPKAPLSPPFGVLNFVLLPLKLFSLSSSSICLVCVLQNTVTRQQVARWPAESGTKNTVQQLTGYRYHSCPCSTGSGRHA